MKLLLDESVPRRLKQEFPSGFEVSTVQDMGWEGTRNGALLKRAKENGFTAVLTTDKNMEYQQNLDLLPCIVVVFSSLFARYEDLRPLVPAAITELANTNVRIARIEPPLE